MNALIKNAFTHSQHHWSQNSPFWLVAAIRLFNGCLKRSVWRKGGTFDRDAAAAAAEYMTCTTGRGRRPSSPPIHYPVLYYHAKTSCRVSAVFWSNHLTRRSYFWSVACSLYKSMLEKDTHHWRNRSRTHVLRHLLGTHHSFFYPGFIVIILCPVLSLVRVPVLWPVLPLTLHDSISWECVLTPWSQCDPWRQCYYTVLSVVAMLSPAPHTSSDGRVDTPHNTFSLWLCVDLLNNPELSLVSY